jgi:ribosomal-protein-alanine N-acetyltransferase
VLFRSRAWREEEAVVRARWGSDAEIVRWTGVPAGYTLEDARLHGATIETLRRRGVSVHFAIVDDATDEVLGACDLRLLEDRRRGAEIGYLLGAAARGRGHMNRALTLMIDWALGDLGLPRVQALVHPDNTASRRVLDRLGFRCDGPARTRHAGGARREERILFSLVSRELSPPRAGRDRRSS